MKSQQNTVLSTVFISILACAYLGVLAAFIFLPEGTVLERLHSFTSGVCAQVHTHTFHVGDEYLPLCARDTGMYLGFLGTLITFYCTGRGRAKRLPPLVLCGVLVVGIVALAIDGTNSLLLDLHLPHSYQPNNLLRLGTGLVTGLAIAALITPVFNQLLWVEYNERRSIASWKEYSLHFPVLILCFFAVIAQSPLLLYPIAILSTLGVLTIASSVNMIIILAISKREQTFVQYREVIPFVGLALLCAIGELLALAQAKAMLIQQLGIVIY